MRLQIGGTMHDHVEIELSELLAKPVIGIRLSEAFRYMDITSMRQLLASGRLLDGVEHNDFPNSIWKITNASPQAGSAEIVQS
jgi:hypothetical protein